MKTGPWAGCSLPGADDFVEVGNVDLSGLDVSGLLSLAQYIGTVPMPIGKNISEEVVRQTLIEHMKSA